MVNEALSSWIEKATCRTADQLHLFAEGAAQNRAMSLCVGCPVRTECLAHALDNRIEYGVWGGTTERQRRAILRRRPCVISWRQLLEAARAHHDRGAYSDDDEPALRSTAN
ncbi:WhiB family transcriptional regulator [Streptomyces sp. NPDC088788]|uniref:WhiB family transcriptional regulator n=1 Tax=Streptomyces sp. NPDC088788 TaxID=3365898 RepID=UPI0038248E7B